MDYRSLLQRNLYVATFEISLLNFLSKVTTPLAEGAYDNSHDLEECEHSVAAFLDTMDSELEHFHRPGHSVSYHPASIKPERTSPASDVPPWFRHIATPSVDWITP